MGSIPIARSRITRNKSTYANLGFNSGLGSNSIATCRSILWARVCCWRSVAIAATTEENLFARSGHLFQNLLTASNRAQFFA
jgi:hypothetical protein